ncbi:hypothetical protein GOP47_0002374 [Adiantum capillus-veneris]|uniref:Uncharacterized protein n=1 Tax=Adiantum capillus-veneris TaxID=13818 RepID=A0A9D4ZQX1_ADICA|nr:hypothetical protein GOP47_0002374 [Adiantum capillus-veneris]
MEEVQLGLQNPTSWVHLLFPKPPLFLHIWTPPPCTFPLLPHPSHSGKKRHKFWLPLTNLHLNFFLLLSNLSIFTLEHKITNLSSHNLSSHLLSSSEHRLLGLGLPPSPSSTLNLAFKNVVTLLNPLLSFIPPFCTKPFFIESLSSLK